MAAEKGAFAAANERRDWPAPRFLDRIYLYSGYLAGIFLIVIFVLMMALSLGRQVRMNIPAGDDFASWCMAAMAFLGLAHTFRAGEMIRVGLVLDRVKGGARRWIEIACLAVGLGFLLFFTWHATYFVYESWRFNAMSNGVIAVPLWIPQIGFALGLAILLLSFVDELIHALRGGAPRYERPPPQTAEEVVERALQSGV